MSREDRLAEDRAVVLVTDAGTEAGRRLAEGLLDAGFRVAVTGRHAATLTHTLHGRPADTVMAVAADLSDPWQSTQVRNIVIARFGRIDAIRSAGEGLGSKVFQANPPESKVA